MHFPLFDVGRIVLVRAGQLGVSISTLAMVLTFPLPAAAQNVLSLTDAQRMAVERSRQLAGQDAAVAADRDLAVSAAQNPDPVLRVGIDNLPVSGADQFSIGNDFMTQRSIGVTQEFTRGDKKRLRGEHYDREADKTLAEKAEAALVIQRDTALAWLDRYYSEASAELIGEQIRQAQGEIEAAQTTYRSGRGSQSDVLAARTALVGLQDRASEIARKVRIAKIALVREVGELGELPLAQRPRIDHIPIDPGALDTHIAMHPEIIVLAKQEDLAATDARLAQANKQSDWSVGLSYGMRGSQYSNMTSIGLSVPLQWDQANRQDREVAAKLAQVEQIRAQREEAMRVAVAEVRSMIAEWESARERQTRLENELVPLSTERTQAELSAYRSGKSSLNDVLVARRNEVDARLQALQMEAETARLWAQLNFHFLRDDAGHVAPDKDAQ
ncbi:outer membrane efflux protein [mine drainage metagenome]|uniref:Outer membrane efflux protein n=1 Tax=mine drainage metagenome TaxID=410659 RepID=A0A1J5QYI4_9ZZZZ